MGTIYYEFFHNVTITTVVLKRNRWRVKSPGSIDPGLVFFGAEDEVRTRDIQLGKLTLYQLSYSRIGGAV